MRKIPRSFLSTMLPSQPGIDKDLIFHDRGCRQPLEPCQVFGMNTYRIKIENSVGIEPPGHVLDAHEEVRATQDVGVTSNVLLSRTAGRDSQPFLETRSVMRLPELLSSPPLYPPKVYFMDPTSLMTVLGGVRRKHSLGIASGYSPASLPKI